MTKTVRRLLYILFFILFFILTPIFIGYSLGYRYNLTSGKIEKYGAFYIKSYPSGAKIFLNNQYSGHKTPDQITEVKSGTYLVKAQKDNYIAWQKRLVINPGITTYVRDIVFFLDNIKKTDLGAGANDYLINKNQDKYAYINPLNNEIFITDIEQAKNYSIFQLNKKYELIDWSADNQKILLSFGSELWIFDINQKTLEKLSLVGVEKISWDNQNSNLFWYLKNGQLSSYDLVQKLNPIDRTFDFPQKITDFYLKNNYLIILYENENNYSLEQVNKNSLETKIKLDNLFLGKLQILMADNNWLIFTLGAELYIQNPIKGLINIPATMVNIHDDRLLISSGHEIILYNFKEDYQELIDRSSQLVSELTWHPNGSYFLTEVNGQTNIAEIDGRDRRNSITFLENPIKKMYLFNKKGDRLFILTPKENFYLTIQ